MGSNTATKINVMQAFENGQKIEVNDKSFSTEEWYETSDPQWDWVYYDYRVKPSFKLSFPPTVYRVDSYGVCEVQIEETLVELGMIRATRSQAEVSYARHVQISRLEQLIYQFQDETDRKHDYYAVAINSEGTKYIVISATHQASALGEIRVSMETAEKVCEILNNKEYEL